MSSAAVRSWIVMVLLAWGVFALGASRPWGYIPLLTGMLVYGAVALVPDGRRYLGSGLCGSLVGVCGAVLFQVVPASGMRDTAVRTLSVDPRATTLALICLAACSWFFVGLARTLELDGPRRLTAHLVGLGAVVAILGIVEASTTSHVVYRLAELPLPPDSTPHGPFSSRNHYAAWMLMVLALTISYLCAHLEQGRTWGGRIVALQCAGTLMAIAVVQTRSRSGIIGLVLAVVALGALLMRRTTAGKSRMLMATSLAAFVVAGIVMAGPQSIASRFFTKSWQTAHGRVPIWRQTVAIVRDFPVAGAGLNTYRTIVRSYPAADLDQPYEAAHNDYLQLAAEGGILVGLPMLLVVGFFIWEIRERLKEPSSDRMNEWLRAGAIVGLALVALQETVEFSLQIPGNAALFMVLAAIAVHRVPGGSSRRAKCGATTLATQERKKHSHV